MGNGNKYDVNYYIKKKDGMKKNGKFSIYGRIDYDKPVGFTTGLDVYLNAWDTDNGKVKTSSKTSRAEANFINSKLDLIRMKAKNYYWELFELDEEITSEILVNLLLGKTQIRQTLLYLFDDFINQQKKIIGIDICQETYERYVRTRRYLAEFIKEQYQVSDVAIRKVSIQFIQNFEVFLRTKKKCNTNMVYKYMQYLKKIVKLAFDSGLIKRFSFGFYKMKKDKIKVGFLTEQELLSMMSKKIEIERLEKIRDVFIFSCFTGLAYAEVLKLRKNQINTFFDGKQWILTERQKNDNTVNVPLFKIPQYIIKKYEGRIEGDYLLPVMSNQKTNAYLKELAAICGINKKLTFHMARHTFATTITLTNGIPLETVGALLGHLDLKSTRIYAEVTGQKIINELPLLNGRLDQYEQAFGA